MKIEGLHDLEKLKCPALEVRKVNVAIQHPELVYRRELNLDDERLKTNHSNQQIASGTLEIKTFETDLLLPLSYAHKEETYRSYNNFIDFIVTYNSAHLLQIVIRQGIKTLKKTDEQHLNEIVLDRKVLSFRYDFTESVWKQSQQEVFEQEKEMIENYKKSDEFTRLTMNYMKSMANLENEAILLANRDTMFQSISDFLTVKAILNEISDAHLQLLENDLNRVLQNLQKLDDDTLDKIDKHNAKSDSIVHLRKVGYYVKDGEFYPNTKLLFDFTQKSSSFRSEKSIREMQGALSYYASTRKGNFIDINGSDFKIAYKKFMNE